MRARRSQEESGSRLHSDRCCFSPDMTHGARLADIRADSDLMVNVVADVVL